MTEAYDSAAETLAELLRTYRLTPPEAIDYIAVEKSKYSVTGWAEVRDREHQTISKNVQKARQKINQKRLDARVNETDSQVEVYVEGRDGETHKLPFSKTTNVVGEGEAGGVPRVQVAELLLVYESMTAVSGYYVRSDGEEYEATLWYDGEPYNSFQDFDHFDEWGSPEQKADVVLWREAGDDI